MKSGVYAIVKDTLKAARKLLKQMSGEDQKMVEACVSVASKGLVCT